MIPCGKWKKVSTRIELVFSVNSQTFSGFSIFPSGPNKHWNSNSVLPSLDYFEDEATNWLGQESHTVAGYVTLRSLEAILTIPTESIADHMYRMSMLALFAPPSLSSRIDIVKVMKMCLFHDEYSCFLDRNWVGIATLKQSPRPFGSIERNHLT